MRPVRSVHYHHGAVGMGNAGNAFNVADYPLVGGGSQHHGTVLFTLKGFFHVGNVNVKANSEVLFRRRVQPRSLQTQQFDGVAQRFVGVACHKNFVVGFGATRKSGKKRPRTAVYRQKGAFALPQSRRSVANVLDSPVRIVQIVEPLNFRDVQRSRQLGKIGEFFRFPFVSRHVHCQHVLFGKFFQHLQKSLFHRILRPAFFNVQCNCKLCLIL